MGRQDNVFVVIATFNRADYLKDLLASVAALNPAPAAVVVIDNASTDATPLVVEEARTILGVPLHYKLLEHNVGGSGGFNAGVELALEKGAQWLWLMDDDVTAVPDAIGGLSKWMDSYDALVGRRYDPAGKPFFWQHKFVDSLGIHLPVRGDVFAESDVFPTNVGCFEGMIVHANAVAAVGLPDPRFFITWDDAMYGWLIALDRKVMYVDHFTLRKARPQRTVDLGIRHLNDSSNLSRFYVMRNRGIVAKYLQAKGRYNRIGFALGTFLTAAKELLRLVLVERTLSGAGKLWEGWRASKPIIADSEFQLMPPLERR